MLHVGLTGNIATGKSYAAAHFESLGARVIDADRIVHALLDGGAHIRQKLVESFGRGILREDGRVDRTRLGRIVFFDSAQRKLLNGIMHPAVHAEIRQQMAAADQAAPDGIIIVDAALMIETGGYREYDCLIVAACNPSLQLERLMSRDGLTAHEAQARIASQMPMEEKVKFADYIIDTSGTLASTRDQVEAIYRELNILIRTNGKSKS